MSNMYFLNQSRGMHIDFSVAFHLFSMLDFLDVFLVRVAAAHREEYLVGEPGLDIIFPFPPPSPFTHVYSLSLVGFIHVTYILFYFINFILFMSILTCDVYMDLMPIIKITRDSSP